MFRKIVVVSMFITFILLMMNSVVSANIVEEPKFFVSPINDAENVSAYNSEFYSTGLLTPEHLVGSYYAVSDDEYKVMSSLPSKWDWRKNNGVTPVQNQGNCGSCYAFGSIGMIESYIKVSEGKAYDLSEEQAKNCMWESTGCLGGTVQWAMNPFTQNGVILEKDFPYNPTSGLCQNIEPTLRITEWNLLSTEKALTNEQLKRYIIKAPIVTSLLVEGWNKSYNGSYVLSPDKEGKKHAVVLVGWDDSKGDENVSGHWIFKNSWGNKWGDSGYGYIEYNKGNVGTHVSIVGGYEDYNHNVHTINYDDAGWNDAFGAYGFDRIRGLCKFDIGTEDIKGIEFWTTGATSDIDLYLYDAFDGKKLGNLLYSYENLTYDEPGYHSVKITESINSATGKIVVVANIQNIDCVYFDDKVAPIAIDKKANNEVEKCYVSIGDPNHKWYDQWYDTSKLKMGDGTTNKADIALRLRINGTQKVACEYIFLETDGFVRNVTVGDSISFIVNCVDQYGSYADCNNITYSNTNKTVGIINDSTFIALVPGETIIQAIGECEYTKSNEIVIMVTPKEAHSKEYLTEEEFKERMADLQKQLDEVEKENENELLLIIDKLNNTHKFDKVIIRVPNDTVSVDTFDKMMDDIQEQIENMQNKRKTLYKSIIDLLNRIFD